MSIVRLHLAVPALLLAFGANAAALTIVVDYSLDSGTGNFFGAHPEARAVMAKAASDLGSVLATSPSAVLAHSFSGTSQGTTVSYDWSLTFANPKTGATATQSVLAAADTVTIYAGFRGLSGQTLETSDYMQASETVTAQNASGTVVAAGLAASASNDVMPRGDSPVIGSKTVTFDSTSYTLRYGAFGGSISFNKNVDQNWSFNLDAPVAGRYDFYSAALRGMVETLGFGQSEAWAALASGTTWNGAHAAALFGGGDGLITTDGHIAFGLTGTSLFDGSTQEALMASGLAMGSRRSLTTLDIAFLQDQGFRMVPEPGPALLLGLGLALISLRRFRLV